MKVYNIIMSLSQQTLEGIKKMTTEELTFYCSYEGIFNYLKWY
jgi:hypothetical protein